VHKRLEVKDYLVKGKVECANRIPVAAPQEYVNTYYLPVLPIHTVIHTMHSQVQHWAGGHWDWRPGARLPSLQDCSLGEE